MPHAMATVAKKFASLAAMVLFHSYFFSHSIKPHGLPLPAVIVSMHHMPQVRAFWLDSHMRQNAYYGNLKWIFEDLLPCYCYAINTNSRTIRSQFSQPASTAQVPNLLWSWHPFHKNKATFAPLRFKESAEITKAVRFCSIFNFKVTACNKHWRHKRKKSVVLFKFHTLVVIRNKPSDVFAAASLTLSAYTLTRIYSEPRANRSRGSNGSHLVFHIK